MPTSDILVENHGSIVLLWPLRKDGLGHYASEEKLVAWIAELMTLFVGLARTQADAERE
jgi:hypothetical protein